MISKLDDMLKFQQTALNLRVHRQQLLASNVANADTPNFKARDIDFSSALRDALSASPHSGNVRLMTTSSRHLGSATDSVASAKILFRTPQQLSMDGNTVEMDAERARFADNSIHMEANLTFISGQIKTMLTAIQGQ